MSTLVPTVVTDVLAALGRAVFFLARTIVALPALVLRPRLVIEQLYAVGVLSLIIIVVSGMFVGMVLGLQGFNTLSNFGAEQSLGWRCRWCASSGRSSPLCCSPAGRAPP